MPDLERLASNVFVLDSLIVLCARLDIKNTYQQQRKTAWLRFGKALVTHRKCSLYTVEVEEELMRYRNET